MANLYLLQEVYILNTTSLGFLGNPEKNLKPHQNLRERHAFTLIIVGIGFPELAPKLGKCQYAPGPEARHPLECQEGYFPNQGAI